VKQVAFALILTLSCTGVMVATNGGIDISIFLVTCALAVPFLMVYFLIWKGRFSFYGIWLIGAYILLNYGLNIHTAKFTSVVYSAIFLVSFLVVMNCWHHLPRREFIFVLKTIIVIYFVNVLVSQALVAANVPYEYLGGFFHRLYDERIEAVRYYGFSSEPSYAAFIVLVSFYALYRLSGKRHKRDWLAYGALVVYQIVAFRSIYGYLLAMAVSAVIVYRELPRRAFYLLPFFLLVLGVATNFVVLTDQGGRLIRVGSALITGEVGSLSDLNLLDASLFMRIAPLLEYLQSANLVDYRFYLGHGAMTSTDFFTNAFYTHVHPDSDILRAGFLPAFLYDYGLVGAAIVLAWASKTISRRRLSVPNLFLLMALFNANFNTQLFWFIIIVFAVAKLYQPGGLRIDVTSNAVMPKEVGAQ